MILFKGSGGCWFERWQIFEGCLFKGDIYLEGEGDN